MAGGVWQEACTRKGNQDPGNLRVTRPFVECDWLQCVAAAATANISSLSGRKTVWVIGSDHRSVHVAQKNVNTELQAAGIGKSSNGFDGPDRGLSETTDVLVSYRQ